jgi:spore germination cell wall hydrolase CwlJ-like protein
MLAALSTQATDATNEPEVVYVEPEYTQEDSVSLLDSRNLMSPRVEVVDTAISVLGEVDNLIDTPVKEESPYTEEQLEILAVVIYQEAGSNACSDDTRRKVGSVFINRVASTKFPNTFEEVATAERQYGRLYWTGIKWPDRAANEGEAEAVQRAYTIAEELLVNGSILPPNVVWQAEFIQGDGVYCAQDGFYFCYSEVSE